MPSSSTTPPDGVIAEPTHRLAASINHQHILQLDSFTLENGEVLSPCPVAYTTWGSLDEAGRNSLLVCHAFSGSADVSEWWAPLLGEGRALDPALYFIVCVNVLGSAYGTASPLTRPVPGAETYGPTFPATTIRDDVRLQYRVLEHLGVRSLAAVVGGSMGGMHTVEWGAMYPGFIRSFIAICTCAQHSAWGISWGEAQRQAITADPLYLNGYYPSDQVGSLRTRMFRWDE
jgi:homoserine O-acetyltransferase